MSDTLTNPENVTASGGHRDAITATASPRPWRLDDGFECEIVDATGRHVLTATSRYAVPPLGDEREAANAALIVDAVNAAEAWREERRRLELAAAGAERAFVVADARRTLLERYYREVFADRARLRDLVRRMATQLSRSCPEKFGDWTRQGDNACSLIREARAAIGEDRP